MPIPDEQAGPAPKRETRGISLTNTERVYELCNMRCRGEISADEWEEEIRRLEGMR